MVAAEALLHPSPSLFLDQVHAALGAFAGLIRHNVVVHGANVSDRLGAALVLALSGFLFCAAADAKRDARKCYGQQCCLRPFRGVHSFFFNVDCSMGDLISHGGQTQSSARHEFLKPASRNHPANRRACPAIDFERGKAASPRPSPNIPTPRRSRHGKVPRIRKV